MTHPNAQVPAAEHLPVSDAHAADPQPAAPPTADEQPPAPVSTLGQTPHEPTVRPWELELLISGALVFSMLQIPGQLDAWFNGLEPRLDGALLVAVLLTWYYVKLAVYALVGGFIVHLGVRGYWVGVIGLEAVFPHGIVWENTRGGPIMRDIQRRSTPPLQALIDRADRFASMIFGGAFALALLFVFSLLLGGSLMLVAFAVSSRFFARTKAIWLMEGMVFAVVGPVIVAGLVDRYFGERLRPDGRAARTIRAVGTTYNRLQSKALFVPLMLTLFTNLRGRRGARVVSMLLIAGGITFVLKDVLLEAGGMHADGYAYLPDAPGALGVLPGFYDDRRGDGTGISELPYIQSDMVRDPYVRLFIPYRPRRHNLLLRRRCPAVRAAVPAGGVFSSARPRGDAAERAVLACMAALQPVMLDGRPIAPAFRFTTEPKTGIRGIVAYIPVAGLPKGENLITVASLPLADPTPAQAREPRPPFTIPFWL